MIAGAKNDYQSNAELYSPRMNRASDMPSASQRSGAYGQSTADPFETTAGTGSPEADMQQAPYELEFKGWEPVLKLYKPATQNTAQPLELPQTLPGNTQMELPGAKTPEDAQKNGEGAKTMEEISEEANCPVCDNRKYQDGSSDPGVSLKFATKLNPYAATSAVRAHEYQHVRHHKMEADKKDRKIISQTVMLRTRRCPHCGKMYTAGGVTKTVTAAYKDCAQASASSAEGQKLDACV